MIAVSQQTSEDYLNEAIARSEQFWNRKVADGGRDALAILEGAVVELNAMAAANLEFFDAADRLANMITTFRAQLGAQER